MAIECADRQLGQFINDHRTDPTFFQRTFDLQICISANLVITLFFGMAKVMEIEYQQKMKQKKFQQGKKNPAVGQDFQKI